MTDDNPTPISQDELERKLENGESLKGVVIGDADFSGRTFDKNLDFSRAIIHRKINFQSCKFSDEAKADFSEAQFKESSECFWVDTKLSDQGLFKFTNIVCADTANVRFESVDLSGASFYLTDIEGFTFKNIVWGKASKGLTRFAMKDESLFETHQRRELEKLNENKELDDKEKKKKKRDLEINYLRQVEILYRQLKRNYEEKRDYHGEGDFHFGKLEMRRKQKTLLEQWTSLTLPYRLVSSYGKKWGRALINFFIAVFLFACLNTLWVQLKSSGKQSKATNASENQVAKSKSNRNPASDEKQPTPIATKSTKLPPNPPKPWEYRLGKFIDSSLFTFKLMPLQRGLKYEAVDKPIWLGRVGKFVLILEFLTGPTLIALMLLAIRRQFRR